MKIKTAKPILKSPLISFRNRENSNEGWVDGPAFRQRLFICHPAANWLEPDRKILSGYLEVFKHRVKGSKLVTLNFNYHTYKQVTWQQCGRGEVLGTYYAMSDFLRQLNLPKTRGRRYYVRLVAE